LNTSTKMASRNCGSLVGYTLKFVVPTWSCLSLR
jgi:hypothetical protein